MLITDVTLDSYKWQRPRAIRNGKFTYSTSGINIVRIETDEGLTGIGTCAQRAGGAVGRALIEHLRPVVVGQNPMNVERIWHALWVPKLVGRRGTETRVIAGIDIAIWDLLGKITGQPVHRLLGGFRDSVPVYVAGGYYEEGKGLDELADEMRENIATGARAVKMKIGGEPQATDVDRVRVVRETIGPHMKLMVDANNAYRFHEAIQIAQRIEPYDIFWFEEPCAPDDYEGHAKVAAATSIPIATGENEYTRYGFRDLIQHGSAAILQPDAHIMGGITEFRKVADLAATHHLPIAPHGNAFLHVHLLCGLPNGLILEYGGGHMRGVGGGPSAWPRELAIDADGMAVPPDEPGLGFSFSPEFLESLEPHRV